MVCVLCTRRDDDDINDVATMGGVNLVEESRNILAPNAGVVLGQLRSCKDESFLDNATLASRISAVGVYYNCFKSLLSAWPPTDALDNNWCLRRILNIHWSEFVTNDEICSHTGQSFLSDTVRSRHLSFIRHLSRNVLAI